jgi:peptidyl-prolyl cis-trans isomerase D
LIGTVFGSQPNKLSKPIEGHKVFMFSVDSFIKPCTSLQTMLERNNFRPGAVTALARQVLDALKDKANVKDNRAKFL